MKTEVIHADLIRAVLDGKVVQHTVSSVDDWTDLLPQEAMRLLTAQPGYRYRLKPDSVVHWCPVWKATANNVCFTGPAYAFQTAAACASEYHDNLPRNPDAILRLELDPETLAVISAVTESGS